MKVTTNNHRRPIIDGWELSAEEREEFDYLDWQAIDEGRDSASFFRFRGELHDLGEFSRLEENGIVSTLREAGWQAARTDSYFDAVVIRYVDEDGYGDPAVVVGHATW